MRKRLSALTLIEALAVICVIVILSAFAVAARRAHHLASEKARRTACIVGMTSFSKALEAYIQDYKGYFPALDQTGSESTALTEHNAREGAVGAE